MAGAEKLILVISKDRAMQDALREVVTAAGCRMLSATSVANAERRLDGQRPALVLVDPLLGATRTTSLREAPVVEIPVRTSSTGVRRLARHNDGAVRWLKELVAAHAAFDGANDGAPDGAPGDGDDDDGDSGGSGANGNGANGSGANRHDG